MSTMLLKLRTQCSPPLASQGPFLLNSLSGLQEPEALFISSYLFACFFFVFSPSPFFSAEPFQCVLKCVFKLPFLTLYSIPTIHIYSSNNQTHVLRCLLQISSWVSQRHKSKSQVELLPPKCGSLPQIPISVNDTTSHQLAEVRNPTSLMPSPISQTQLFP